MTCKLLLALAMSEVVLVGCEDSKPEVEYSSLHQLCASQDATPSQVQEFLKFGADVNARDGDVGSPLMIAAWHNKNPEVISVLLKAGADAKVEDRDGGTALYYAENNESINGTPAYWKLNDASFD